MNTRSFGRAASPIMLAVLLSGAMASASMAQGQAPTTPQPTFDAALEAYEQGHYQQAYAMLVELAEQGHDEAMRMARDMWRFGPSLFGQAFGASERQQAMWLMRRGDDDVERVAPPLR